LDTVEKLGNRRRLKRFRTAEVDKRRRDLGVG
jgi:hypothetical protein